LEKKLKIAASTVATDSPKEGRVSSILLFGGTPSSEHREKGMGRSRCGRSERKGAFLSSIDIGGKDKKFVKIS